MKIQIRVLLMVLLLLDLVYSFYQHAHLPLDGDVADIVLPTTTKGSYQVLEDPFGLGALLRQERYPDPNRFFAHGSEALYLRKAPLLLQHFVDPVTSVYLACALFKIALQLFLLWLLAVYANGGARFFSPDTLVAGVLIAPLFQTSGYNRHMGIIDQSVTYTFFYAFPLALLLWFFLPLFRSGISGSRVQLSAAHWLALSLLTVVLPLSGPLIPGVVLVVCPVLALAYMWRRWRNGSKLSWTYGSGYMVLLACMLLGSLYSLYLGTFNIFNDFGQLPLAERYARLPIGIVDQFTQKLGFPVLFAAIAFNAFYIRRFASDERGGQLLGHIRWVLLFALVYLLLLPLGGYRSYRANILRYDTIMPVTLMVFYLFGATTLYVGSLVAHRYRKAYGVGVAAVLLIFTNSDRYDPSTYACERAALETLSKATEPVVFLPVDCSVLGWRKFDDPAQSEVHAGLLHYWNITPRPVLYYQVPKQ